MSVSRKIERLAEARNIEYLLHFTPIENIQSILSNGLASRADLDHNGISYTYTDDWREDDKPDALSLSVTEINYAMLKAKRKSCGDGWAVLAIDPSVLWTHSCRFCWTNAASREVKNYRGFLGGPWGFERMFQDAPMSSSDAQGLRDAYNIADNMPTDNAAEVQVFDPIDSDLILAVGVRTEQEKIKIENIMTKIGQIAPVEIVADILQ